MYDMCDRAEVSRRKDELTEGFDRVRPSGQTRRLTVCNYYIYNVPNPAGAVLPAMKAVADYDISGLRQR